GAAPTGGSGDRARAQRPLAAELREPVGPREDGAHPLAALLDGARPGRLVTGTAIAPASEVMAEDDLRGVHVLVVEDSKDTLEFLREVLQTCGAFVTTAASKKEAERRLQALLPHATVSDVAMPDDGVELARYAVQLARDRGAPVPMIAISAHRYEPADLKRVGFVEFVQKPLDPIALCSRIRSHVHAVP